MKRFLIYTLIFAMFSCTVMVPWADERSRNVNQNYGSCSATDSDGPLSSNGSISVDIDYPGEGDGFIDEAKSAIETFFLGYGIEYSANASVSGEAPNDDYEGYYEVYAGVCIEDDHRPRARWVGEVNKSASANHRLRLDKDDTDWDNVDASFELNACTGWGDVDGSSPEKSWQEWVKTERIGFSTTLGTTWTLVDRHRPALSHDVYANAWNFPDPAEHNREHN